MPYLESLVEKEERVTVRRQALRPAGASPIQESPAPESRPSDSGEVPAPAQDATPDPNRKHVHTHRETERVRRDFSLFPGRLSRIIADPDAVPDDALSPFERDARDFYNRTVMALGGPDAVNPAQSILLTRALSTYLLVLRLDAEVGIRTQEGTLINKKTGRAHGITEDLERMDAALSRLLWRLGLTGVHRKALMTRSPGLQEWLKMRQPKRVEPAS